MIVRTAGRDVELRDIFAGSDRIPTPSEAGGRFTYAGRFVRTVDAVGIPTVLSGIRLISETVAAMPLLVHKRTAAVRVPAPDASQTSLLGERPNEKQTPFQVWSYIVASMNTEGGGFLQKIKDRQGRVLELYPMDPTMVIPKVEGGDVVFDVRSPNGAAPKRVTRSDIIYFPGILVQSPFIGVSPIAAHRQSLGTALAADEFSGRYYQNDGTPSGVIVKGPQTVQQRKELRESWEAQHRGLQGAHRMAVLWGDMDYKPIAINAHDAAMIESKKWNVEEIARMLRLPGWILGGQDQSPRMTPEQRNMELLQFSFMAWLKRVSQPLHADDDLFPDKTLVPIHDVDGLLMADVAARNGAYLVGRQAGWLSVNDIRFKEGLPPIAGGDIYQVTPVGGSPNLQPALGSAGSENTAGVENAPGG